MARVPNMPAATNKRSIAAVASQAEPAMKKPGDNTVNKVARRRRIVQLRAKRYSNAAMAASLGVDVSTVERDIKAVREEGLEELPRITAETWGAVLLEQYRERVAELRERLDLVDPRDHISAIRIFPLLRNEDNQLTKLWQSLGLIHQLPPHELVIVRVMRTMQQLPPEQLEEIYNAIGSEEEFAKLFRRYVPVPLHIVSSGPEQGTDAEDDRPDEAPVAAD